MRPEISIRGTGAETPPLSGHADQRTSPAAVMAGLERLSHHLHVPGRLEREVRAPVCQFLHPVERLAVRGIDGVGGAELLCHLQPIVVQIQQAITMPGTCDAHPCTAFIPNGTASEDCRRQSGRNFSSSTGQRRCQS